MIKYSVIILALYGLVINCGDGKETPFFPQTDVVIQYTMPTCNPVREIFGLSQKQLTIAIPEHCSQLKPKLSYAFRLFYSRCHEDLDIRSIEEALTNFTPVSKPTLNQNYAFLSTLNLTDPSSSTHSDYYFCKTPSNNATLSVISHFHTKFDKEYARITKQLIGALIKPDLLKDGTQHIDLTLILPDIEEQAIRLK